MQAEPEMDLKAVDGARMAPEEAPCDRQCGETHSLGRSIHAEESRRLVRERDDRVCGMRDGSQSIAVGINAGSVNTTGRLR